MSSVSFKKFWKSQDHVDIALRGIFKQYLEKTMGAKSKHDSIHYDFTVGVEETVFFKTMSDGGKSDIAFANKLQRFFEANDIPFTRYKGLDDPMDTRKFTLSKEAIEKLMDMCTLTDISDPLYDNFYSAVMDIISKIDPNSAKELLRNANIMDKKGLHNQRKILNIIEWLQKSQILATGFTS